MQMSPAVLSCERDEAALHGPSVWKQHLQSSDSALLLNTGQDRSQQGQLSSTCGEPAGPPRQVDKCAGGKVQQLAAGPGVGDVWSTASQQPDANEAAEARPSLRSPSAPP